MMLARMLVKSSRAALAGAALALCGGSALASEQITLVAFGDSLVAGYGLPVEDGFTAQLQTWLQDQGIADVTVVNAGVSGDTTSAGLARLDWSIGAEASAVLLELGANDGLRGVDPAITRANLDAMLTRLGERGLPVLLAGMVAPQNWGAEYAEAFAAIFPDLAEKHGVPLYPFFLEGLTEDPSYAQDDGLHPSKKGVAKLVETIGPSILDLIARARGAETEG